MARPFVGLDQTIESEGVVDTAVVTGAWWIFARVQVLRGSLTIGSSDPGPAFSMFVPPRSILRMRFVDAYVDAPGLGGDVSLPRSLLDAPRVREGRGPMPETAEDVIGQVAEGLAIDPDADAPPTAKRARRMLHDVTFSRSPVRDVARALGVAQPTISRTFHAAYGIPPKEYVHRARICESVFRLLAGRSILEAAFESGFGDVSRFYRQFRRLVAGTPRAYRTLADHETPRRSPGRSP